MSSIIKSLSQLRFDCNCSKIQWGDTIQYDVYGSLTQSKAKFDTMVKQSQGIGRSVRIYIVIK